MRVLEVYGVHITRLVAVEHMFEGMTLFETRTEDGLRISGSDADGDL